MVDVPDVYNKSLATAEIELSNVGLICEPSYAYHSQIPSGNVFRQTRKPIPV